MEKAVFVSKIKDLKYLTGEHKRIYFGNEFCQNLIPDIRDLMYVLDVASNKRMGFTLVTPFVTNEGMGKLRSLLDCLLDKQPESEVVINDWGLLHWLSEKYPNVKLALGRLLTKQKRGPRILNLIGRVPVNMIQYFSQSNVDTPALSDFLISKGIKRVELDNLLQGIIRNNPLIKGSLYIPFAYVTTTRFCLMNDYKERSRRPRAVFPCRKECQDYLLKLRHKKIPVELFLKGNTQFFKNETLPDNLKQLNIDRLVYQPQIPL